MKTTAALTLTFSDPAARLSLAEVLAPDNRDFPRGLILSVEQSALKMELSVKSGSPSASLSTVLAFLGDIALFQEVWLLSRRRDARVRRGAR